MGGAERSSIKNGRKEKWNRSSKEKKKKKKRSAMRGHEFYKRKRKEVNKLNEEKELRYRKEKDDVGRTKDDDNKPT